MLSITLKQCEYFRAVAQTGGIASAALRVGVSQPAVAQAITKLEDMTGLILFHRLHAKGMELTKQGEEFLRHVEQLLGSADQVNMAVEQIADNRAGTVRLGCFQSLAPFYLARILSGYKALMPDVVVEAQEMLQQDLTTALLKNELDLAIMYDLGLDGSALSLQPLASAPPYLIVPSDHKLAGQKKISICALDGEAFILFDAPQSREYFYDIFARFGISPNIAFRSASIESVRASVANGLGLSILSMRPASNVTYDGKEVACLKLEEALAPTPIVLAQNAARPTDALTEGLAEYCKGVFES
jgi:DNA-binding transcriptional LysR family regulator